MDRPTGYDVTPEGVFLPHAAWDELVRSISALSLQNERLLLTIADLLADPVCPPDRYDLRALRELL